MYDIWVCKYRPALTSCTCSCFSVKASHCCHFLLSDLQTVSLCCCDAAEVQPLKDLYTFRVAVGGVNEVFVCWQNPLKSSGIQTGVAVSHLRRLLAQTHYEWLQWNAALGVSGITYIQHRRQSLFEGNEWSVQNKSLFVLLQVWAEWRWPVQASPTIGGSVRNQHHRYHHITTLPLYTLPLKSTVWLFYFHDL